LIVFKIVVTNAKEANVCYEILWVVCIFCLCAFFVDTFLFFVPCTSPENQTCLLSEAWRQFFGLCFSTKLGDRPSAVFIACVNHPLLRTTKVPPRSSFSSSLLLSSRYLPSHLKFFKTNSGFCGTSRIRKICTTI